MKRTTKFESHTFHCLNCGQSIPLARKLSNKKEKFHRKKLYCPFCNNTVNMIECKDEFERRQFFEDFEAGKFIEEANASLEYCK